MRYTMWSYWWCLNLLYILATFTRYTFAQDVTAVWRWSCENGKCAKYPLKPEDANTALCLEACKMFCNEYGTLWPRPTGNMDLGNHMSKININNIDFEITGHGKSDDLMQAALQRFKRLISSSIPSGTVPKMSGKSVVVYIVNKNPDVTNFTLRFDESYDLHVSAMGEDRINATIVSENFFGARHGLETLSQLVLYDDIRDHLLIIRDVNITDRPVYPYRGIMLDTARNYYSLDSIKTTIDAMAAVKLNTFHWHITDSHSFPFVSSRRPNLTKYGAYTPEKVYTPADIRQIVRYAHVRGVRVMPEYDAPAHVGEGFQGTDLTVCFKAEPWTSYCVEPPCGQFNPTKDELYDVLEDIYSDLSDAFQSDIFHMGGDEVSEKCWNSSEEIQHFMLQNGWTLDKTGFLNLWNHFQSNAQERAYKGFGKRLPIILWTSTLTEYDHVSKYLNKDDYILQVWTTGVDPQIKGLLENGYQLIISNYDALYLDCGFGAWVGSGNNWCSPYIGWQKVYDNSPALMALQYKDQIFGGEAALWSEQSDTSTLASRLWPRSAALAERLWAEPATGWIDAEHRMLHMRQRLVRMGVPADSIQPEWCYQNEGYCYL